MSGDNARNSPAAASRPRARRRRRRSLSLIVLAVAIVYAAVVALSVRHYGGNLSSLIDVGDRAGARVPGGLGHHVVVFRHSDGYDGQAYYLVADDPFLQRRAYRDAFRYQRIGYPLVVWAVSLGQRAWRPAAMVGVNLIAVMAVAYLSGVIILLFGRGSSPWWALACAINPSLLIGVQLDLAEPLITALALAGLLLYLRGRAGWAAVALAAALLTREVAILFILPLFIAEAAARRIRRALALAATAVPYVVWQLVLLAVLGRAGAGTSESNFGLPFAGIRAVVAAARHTPLRSMLIHQGSILALVIFVGVAVVVSVVQLSRRRDVVVGSMLVHGVAAFFAAPAIWLAYSSAARVFGGLFPLTVFAMARYRGRAFGLLTAAAILLTLFTFVRLIAISPAQPYYLTP